MHGEKNTNKMKVVPKRKNERSTACVRNATAAEVPAKQKKASSDKNTIQLAISKAQERNKERTGIRRN